MASQSQVTIVLTEGEHRELLQVMLNYSLGKTKWATSPGLREKISNPTGATS